MARDSLDEESEQDLYQSFTDRTDNDPYQSRLSASYREGSEPRRDQSDNEFDNRNNTLGSTVDKNQPSSSGNKMTSLLGEYSMYK